MNWTCPHCERDQVVTQNNRRIISEHINIDDLAEGSVSAVTAAIGCANEKCKRLTVTFSIRRDARVAKGGYVTFEPDYKADPLYFERLIPNSSSKTQPPYIPPSLIEDYAEACAIRDRSPKAAATLARRCIQGMIRDFCGITKNRLLDEIRALREAVDDGHAPPGVTIETVEAIDHVRGIGNIGAHMERDINLIIPVDTGEAQALIELIEMLFDEWYVARHKRRQRLAEIARIGADKQKAIIDGRSGKAGTP